MEAARDSKSRLSDEDFKFICKFVYDSTGIVLNDSKREMVYRRLARIVRERKLDSFEQYCQMLKQQPEQEIDFFVNAITTNLTSFFREQHHFDYLLANEIPNLLTFGKVENNSKKRLRIWSSASSTGEEPYSIAMTLLEAFHGELKNWDVKILATDIDSNVLSHGKGGIYDINKITDIPPDYKNKYFTKGVGKNANKVKVNENVQKLITFKQLNLLHEWPMKGPFDVIFCRNVIIYFDKETQKELFARYYGLLKPGGLLILGHSESLGQFAPHFDNVGRTIFRKPNGLSYTTRSG